MRRLWIVSLAGLCSLFFGCNDSKDITSPEVAPVHEGPSTGTLSTSSINAQAVATGTDLCGGRYIYGNPYSCCSNGGNCTWWAWYAAQMVWGNMPMGYTWGNAASWATRAAQDGYPVRSTPAVHTIGVNTRLLPGGCNGMSCGHVAWVVELLPNDMVRVAEMGCCSDCLPGTQWRERPISFFDAGFIYPRR